MSSEDAPPPRLAVIELDRDGCVRSWSAEAADLFGVTVHDAVGTPLASTADWRADDRIRGLIAGMRLNDVWVCTREVVRLSGAVLRLRTVTSRHLIDGQPVLVICCEDVGDAVAVDVDDSYPIRSIQGQTEPVLYCNQHRLITVAGPTERFVSGYPLADLLGHDPREFLVEDDVPGWEEMWDWALAAPGQTQSSLVRVVSRGGPTLWIEHNAINFLDDPAVASMVIHCRPAREPISS